MGEVYRATDTRLDRQVAIKVLPSGSMGDAAAEARFDREARAIAALSHPNICALYDVGRDVSLDGRHLQFFTDVVKGRWCSCNAICRAARTPGIQRTTRPVDAGRPRHGLR